MDIGTGKPTPGEQARVRHHLVDIAEPDQPFTVDDWLVAAEHAIAAIRARGHRPIVVGGTHLYAQALLFGLFRGPDPDPALRAALTTMDPVARRAELERVDPAAAARIHPADTRRTVRALEVFRQTGTPISAFQQQWSPGGARADALVVRLDWPVADINARINARVRAFMAAGFLDEVSALWSARRLGPQAAQAIGYRQLVDHLEGRVSLDDAVERTKIETRALAKAQRTWLKRFAALPRTVTIAAGGTPAERWAALVLDAQAGAPDPAAGA